MRISPVKTAAVAAACLLATACTGGAPSSEGGGDASGPLRYLIEEPEDAETLQALRDHVAGFSEESGIEVEIETLPWETMNTVLQTQLRSGEGPDVFNWGSGPSFGGALAEGGLLYDLTDAYEERGWEVFDFAKERVTVDGKVFGIPGELETIGIFYNADVLGELGVEPPQDLDGLTAAAGTIREAGLVPLAASDQEGWQGGHYLSMALSSQIGPEGMEELFAGERSWDSPEVVSALQWWKDAQEAGLLVESPTSVDYDTATASFYAGEAAMIPTGSWLVGELDSNADFEVGYIPFPAPDGEGVFSSGLGSGPYISAQTGKAEDAIEFLDFLASEEHAQWTVENLATIPPRPVETEGLEVSPLFAQVLEDVATYAEAGGSGYNIDVLVSDDFNEAMYDGFQAILTDQMTPQEVAASLEAAAQQ
ncbi:MAG TPA: extracellular solute-binding protein [Aquihabitans sp.]|jgi:raffinose/stachyose/melibiose transport system substrate-binding protein|nr:extracellular solute-binding protein [Aquihabitans sp.]